MKPSVTPLFLMSLMLCAACESPLYDSRTKAKPRARTVDQSEQISQSSVVSSEELINQTPPRDCVDRFRNSSICLKLIFEEEPSYQASEYAFSAQLWIWDGESPQSWYEEESLPEVSHRGLSNNCCLPPPIAVSKIAAGRYQLSGIEFHSLGLFEFLIEFNEAEPATALRTKLNLEVLQ